MKQKTQGRASAQPEAQCVASATECTGLMPALPEDAAADAASAALYAIPAAKASHGDGA